MKERFQNDKMQLSPYNYDSKVMGGLNLAKKLTLVDATVREGAQGSIIGFTPEEKLEIIRSSANAGTKFFQVGGLYNSEMAKVLKGKVSEINNIGPDLETEILAWCTNFKKEVWKKELDLALEVGATHLSLLTMLTPYSAVRYGGASFEQVIDDVGEQIAYFVSQGGRVSLDPMDGPRTDFNLLMRAYRTAVEAGAERIRLLDTVGTCSMAGWRYLVSTLREEFRDTKIGVHCHNDYGQAMANVYTSIECGADFVDVCINGLGERAGNASLAEVAAGAEILYGMDTGIELDKLYELSLYVGDISKQPPNKNKPIVGDWTFAHGDEIHHQMKYVSPWMFDGVKASIFGNKQKIILGLKSGKIAAKTKLEDLGYSNVQDDIAQKVIEDVYAETKKRRVVLNDDDIRRIADKYIEI